MIPRMHRDQFHCKHLSPGRDVTVPDERIEMKALSAARDFHRFTKHHPHPGQRHVEKREDDAPGRLEHTPRVFEIEEELLLQEVRSDRKEDHQVSDAIAFGNLRSLYPREAKILPAAGLHGIVEELLV